MKNQKLSTLFFALSLTFLIAAFVIDIAIPLPLLGDGYVEGHMGGLYPDGSNVVPIPYLVTEVAPRYDNLSCANDSEIVILAIGMSNMQHTTNAVIAKLSEPRIKIVNAAIPGRAQQSWGDTSASVWALVDKTLTQHGETRNSVDIVWYFNAWAWQDIEDVDEYINTVRPSWQTTMASINQLYPNAQLIYLTSREYAGYADGNLNPEPRAYRDGFVVQEVIGTRIAMPGDGAPILWQAYQWNPDWTQDHFTVDGVHLTEIGLDKASDLWIDFFSGEPWWNCDAASTATPTSVPVNTATPAATVQATDTPTGVTPTSTATLAPCPPWNQGCHDPQPTRTPWTQ